METKKGTVAIFTYSLTGTTQYLADIIAKEILSSGRFDSTPVMVNLADAFHAAGGIASVAASALAPVVSAASVIGIGGLAWIGLEPPGIRDWIASLPAESLSGKPVFTFISAAVYVEDKAYQRMAYELALKGAHVVGSVTMRAGVSNFVMYTQKRLPISKGGVDSAAAEARALAAKLATWTAPPSAASAAPLATGQKRDESDAKYQMLKSRLSAMAVNPSTCVKCYRCVDGCPAACIEVDPVSGLPKVDSDRCIACCRCANRCPKRAIAPKGIVGTDWEFYGEFDTGRIDPDAKEQPRDFFMRASTVATSLMQPHMKK